MKQKLEVMNTAGEDITASVKSIKLTEGPMLYSTSDLDIELRNLIAECDRTLTLANGFTYPTNVVFDRAYDEVRLRLADFILAHRELFGVEKE